MRQENYAVLNTIELQKTQISDLEVLSVANKEVLKNLKANIEHQKLNFQKISENIGRYNQNVQSDRTVQNVKQVYKVMKNKYESLMKSLNEIKEEEIKKNEQEKLIRMQKIQEIQMDINKLRDDIQNLKRQMTRKHVENGKSDTLNKMQDQSNADSNQLKDNRSQIIFHSSSHQSKSI